MIHKERPILFSTEMVKAILNLLKTITRRLKGLEFINENPDRYKSHGIDENGCALFEELQPDITPWISPIKCPYGKPGDVLWVRETTVGDEWTGFLYKTDHPNANLKAGDLDDGEYQVRRWKPSIHMPKAAARIWLGITDIKVERLQDISEEDAVSEGIDQDEWTWGPIAFPDGTIDNSVKGTKTKWFRDYREKAKKKWNNNGAVESFKTLWISINGADSWEANPWVWVISFKVLSTTGKPVELEHPEPLKQ